MPRPSPESPPSPAAIREPSTRKGALRRQRVLEAAEAHFGRDGYWGTTTGEIAEAAGLTQSALYRYFPTKQALFVEALALRQQEIVEAVTSALQAPGTSRERIERISTATIELAHRYPDMARLRMQAIVVAANDEEVRSVVNETIDRLLEIHRALIEAAKAEGSLPTSVDSDVLANTLSALATQLYASLVLGRPIADVVDRALPSLLRMVSDE